MTHSVLKVELPLSGEEWNIPGDQKRKKKNTEETEGVLAGGAADKKNIPNEPE